MAMFNTRALILAGAAVVLAGVLVWNWIAGWGLVTIDVHGAPLAGVIKSIERQGGVTIRSNADPTTPVTMILDRAPAYEAVETLAIAIDADPRLAYVAAPKSRQIKGVLDAYAGGNNPGGWVVLAGGMGGRGGGGPQRETAGESSQDRSGGSSSRTAENTSAPADRPAGDRPRREADAGGGGWTPQPMMGDSGVDPRTIVWKPSDMEEKNLQAFFDQGAQKTGVLFALPEDWNPAVTRLPKEGPAGEVAARIVKGARGELQEVFLLTVQPPRPQTAAADEEGNRRWEFSRTVFTPQRGGPRNPQWMAERAEAQLAAMPPEQAAEARKQMEEMRAFWASVRGLPEEERRAKIEEMMSRPEIQDRIEERMKARDAKTPPEKREDRMRRYLERKNQIKGPPQKS